MEDYVLITITIFLLLIVAVLFFAIIFTLLEHNFGLLTNKPFYVHFYILKKELTLSQKQILSQQFDFYKKLNEKRRLYFEHRVAVFLKKHQFIGKEDFQITDEVKVLIAATSTMLTFGMRSYLYKIIDKIIVYPNEYYSTINNAYHKGEFNPRMRAIVFSWSDFLAGFDSSNDNLNLGLHEFTHVLHFNSLKSDTASAVIFTRIFTKISKEVHFPANKDKLINSNFFRIYAYTNAFEFLAVLVEHYFESPEEFKQEFPQLYKNIGLMLNFENV